ncbi:outer membrane beta-barrel protein [Novosphingobium sp. FSY-8]|uniref:Outer membrane beta-barrel protein n=1 Tax=Novosphingobium ovatum TaxID=1908523 RepID=A0ABW9X8W0_9SPHN|nr:outer membrane beta-barrel protein [Novosphingobium ovatum]NBC34963.1 outer membrane beta-barrel protein [Novosphingobium ovatum]
MKCTLSHPLLLSAGAVLAMVASPAQAQTEPGFQIYGGVLAGAQQVRISGADVRANGTGEGIKYGALIGVDTSVLTDTRLGIEAEVTTGTMRHTYTDRLLSAAQLRTGRDLYIGVRAGITVAPRTLAFVKAGYTNAQMRMNATQATSNSILADLSGYRVGAGIEYGTKIRARVEYRFSDYGTVKYAGQSLGQKVQSHEIMAGMIYGF